MTNLTKLRESKYGFDAYPLIAQHPSKPHISLHQHPNGPVYWDSDEDCLGSPGSYVQALVDKGNLEVFADVHWIAMSLFNRKALISLNEGGAQ